MLKNIFPKMTHERTHKVILQDLKKNINLKEDTIKTNFPDFEHKNLDVLKRRYILDLENRWDEFSPWMKNDIQNLVQKEEQKGD